MDDAPLSGPAPADLGELLRRRAAQHPEREALAFIGDDGEARERLDYAGLDARARAVGGRLRREGLEGRPVLLAFPNGLDFLAAFFGCLYAGCPAVPTFTLHPATWRRTIPRLKSVIAGAGAPAGLTSERHLADLRALLADDPAASAVRWLSMESLARSGDGGGFPAPDPGRVAMLQYTSGSIAAPKGVVITHGNLLANLLMHDEVTGSSRGAFATWLPLFHDMGLAGSALAALHRGNACSILAPTTFLASPLSWLRVISSRGAAMTGAPNFAYELAARRAAAEPLVGLDLSRLQVAYNASEMVRAETLDAFLRAFAPAGLSADALSPCYGLAEATVVATGRRRDAPLSVRTFQGRRVVGCGRGGAAQTLVVAGPGGEALEDERVGEVWVKGPHVAAGYWDRPEETAATFGARLSDGRGPFLRTGDLGFLSGGELFICGRLKDVLKVKGRTHHPEDLEWSAQRSHPSVRPSGCAAVPWEQEGGEGAALLVEVERRAGADAEAVAAAARRAVREEHGVELAVVAVVPAGSLPKTSSGKIRRRDSLAEWRDGRLRTLFAS